MSLLDAESMECLKSELDLFNVAPTQTSIENTFFVNYHPITSLERGGPLEFVVKTSEDTYLDLQHTILYLKTRILNKNGDAISKPAAPNTSTTHLVAPINYFHATQFKNLDVYINNKLANSSDNLYPYRAYIESALSFDSDARKSQLACSLYYQDEGEDLDWMPTTAEDLEDEDDSDNSGIASRFNQTKYSNTFETWGRLHSDFFSQPKMLPGKNELRIKLQRADPSFCLMAKSNSDLFTVSIDTAILMVRHCIISPHVREAQTKAALTRPLKYPVRRVETKFFTRGSGRSDLSEPNLISGILPRRIIFGLVDSASFNGSLLKNPFNFQHYNVQSVILRKNGNPVPFETLDLDTTNGQFLQGYMSLIQGTGKLHENRGLGITPEQYKYGYTLYGFDLTSDMSSCDVFNLVQEGRISLDVKLGRPTTAAVTMLVYLEYDAVYEIDKDGIIHGNE